MKGRIEFKLTHKDVAYNVEFFTEVEAVHIKKGKAPFQIVPLPMLKERSILAQNDSNLYWLIYDNILKLTEKVDELMTKQ